MSSQTQQNGQNDKEGFTKVEKKQGPRGQRLEKRKQNKDKPRYNSNGPSTSNGQYVKSDNNVNRPGLSYRDLLFQFNNLQKRVDSPKVDLVENGDHYIVKMEVPGLKIDDLMVKLKDSQFLLVSGNKNEEHTKETQDSNSHVIVYKESKYGSFTRRVKLPTLIKYKNGISTSIEDGVLVIICKKENPNIKYEKKIKQQREHETVQQEPVQEPVHKPVQELVQETSNVVNWSDL